MHTANKLRLCQDARRATPQSFDATTANIHVNLMSPEIRVPAGNVAADSMGSIFIIFSFHAITSESCSLGRQMYRRENRI